MPKISLTLVLIVVACAIIGWMAFDPSAAREVTDWVHRQIGNDIPDPKSFGHPNYTPVVPGKGL